MMMNRLSRRHFIASSLALLTPRVSPAFASDKPPKPPKPKSTPPASGNPYQGPSGSAGVTLLSPAAVSQGGIGSGATTLVLYDVTGEFGWLGELYGIMGANLVSHFGGWTAQPVTRYVAGQMNQYSAVVYFGSTYDEPLLRRIRTEMKRAGMRVESSKGEAGAGQHEINFRFEDALRAADDHVVYKNGAKEIAHQEGCSITFMAKPDHDEVGSSCHIHSSLWRYGRNAFGEDDAVFGQFLAGQIACARELAIFFAPTINSYKRFVAGSWAPTTLAWGNDNRTCGFRVVGHGASKRPETRIPGADVNPYLAFAALLAAGLHGIEQGLELGPALEGNAYVSDAERFPSTLRDAITALEESTMARAALGDDVVDHYLNYARTEQRLFDAVVTCYERERLFERG